MNITFVSRAGCLRVMKEAIALKNAGHKVILITNNKEINSSIFDLCIVYTNVKQLETAIGMVRPHTEIFHVHNEPNYPATIIRELFLDAKIVLDVHDSNYWRIEQKPDLPMIDWADEDVAVRCSDALVLPSVSALEDFKLRYGNIPMLFLPAAYNISQLRYKPASFYGGVVSQGGHSIPKDFPCDNYRDYTKLYSELVSKKIMVYAYSISFNDTESETTKHYKALGVNLGSYDYEEMLNILSGHTWNIVGNVGNHYVWKFSLPNKFYDACAVGLPSVNFSNPEVAKIIDQYDIGINVNSVDEFIARWGEHSEKRKNLMLCRKELSLDRQIPNLINLYQEILK